MRNFLGEIFEGVSDRFEHLGDAVRDAVAAMLLTHVAVLAQDSFFNLVDRVEWSDEPAREFCREHRQIVQMIAARHDFIRLDLETTRDLGERGPFVKSFVAEPRVNVVTHHNQITDVFARNFQVIVNFFGIAHLFGDQAKG